jgi:hypothetical protein
MQPYNNNGPAGNNPPNPILTWYQEWADRTPCVTRNSVLVMIGLYIFSWIFDLDGIFGNITDFSIFRFEIYRFFFSTLGNIFFLSLKKIFIKMIR